MTEKEFISGWISKITSRGIKEFPGDFCELKDHKEISLPGKTLVLGEEFFGNFEILSVDGSLVYRAENYDLSKFIIYANRLHPKSILIPAVQIEAKEANSKYEKYIDSIIREMETDYKKDLPLGKNFNSAVNEILRVLNLIRY